MKISTPFGEYPFVFRRVDRREGGLAIIGTVAGIESSVTLDESDARLAAKALAVPVAGVLALVVLRRVTR